MYVWVKPKLLSNTKRGLRVLLPVHIYIHLFVKPHSVNIYSQCVMSNIEAKSILYCVLLKDNGLVFTVRLRVQIVFQPACRLTVNRLRSVYPKGRLSNPGSNKIFVSFSKRPDRLSDPPSLIFRRGLGAIFPVVCDWCVKFSLTALSSKVKKRAGLKLHSLIRLYGVQQRFLHFLLSCVLFPASSDVSC
jgi:hypothetical protein